MYDESEAVEVVGDQLVLLVPLDGWRRLSGGQALQTEAA